MPDRGPFSQPPTLSKLTNLSTKDLLVEQSFVGKSKLAKIISSKNQSTDTDRSNQNSAKRNSSKNAPMRVADCYKNGARSNKNSLAMLRILRDLN